MKKNNNMSREAYYDRIKNLGQVDSVRITEAPNRSLGNLIDYKRASNGVAYGIIKESHKYYIKKAGLGQDPDVSDFAYIGGLGNITSFQYKSLSEADKNRGMLLHTINEADSLNFNKTTEDVAGDELEDAEAKLDTLDAVTATETSPDAEMAAGLSAEPSGGEMATPELPAAGSEELPAAGSEELPAAGAEELPAAGAEELPAVDGAEAVDGLDGVDGDGLPAVDGEETVDGAGAEELAADDPIKELEKSVGKITNKIRKAELEPNQVKSFVNSYLSAFKDKFPDVEIEDRKEMANKILKVVPPEDVEDLGTTIEKAEKAEDAELGENNGSSFAVYAEAMGYDSAQALVECDEDEVTNLVSGFANANAEGENDGDHENVALLIKLINPAILDILRSEYGHDEYADKLAPHLNQEPTDDMPTDDESMEKLEELFGGLRNLGKAAKDKVGQAATAVKDKIGQGYSDVKDKIGQGYSDVKDTIGQAATAVKQTYHAGEVAGEVTKLEKVANDLGKQVQSLNDRLTKSGKEPLNIGSVIATLSNQIKSGSGGVNLAASQVGASLEEINDPASIEVQPEVGFAPDADTLGVVAPESSSRTSITVENADGTKVNVGLNEGELKLRKYIRKRLQERVSGVKSSLNENTKSDKLKKLDEMIGKQFGAFIDSKKKKV